MERRKFGREFRIDAVRLVKERGVSVAQAGCQGRVSGPWQNPSLPSSSASDPSGPWRCNVQSPTPHGNHDSPLQRPSTPSSRIPRQLVRAQRLK